MRDGLKKRIAPKTTGLKKNVNTFSKYNVQYKSRVYQQNVVPTENSCKYDAACENGKSKPLNRRRYYAPFRQPVLGRRYQGKNNVSFRRKLGKKFEVKPCDSKDPRVQRSSECLWTQMPTDSYDTCNFDVEKESGDNPYFCPNSTKSTSRISAQTTNYDNSYSGNYARTNRPLIRSGMQPNTAGQQNSGFYKEPSYSYSYNELIKRRRKDTYVEQLPNYNESSGKEDCCSKTTNKKFNKKDKLSTRGNYSNDKFKVQGAVESSSRLDRLKLDTLKATNNKCSTNCKDVNKFGARSGLYFAGRPRFTNIKENVTNWKQANSINSDTSNALRRVRGNTSALSNSEKRKCCKKSKPDGIYVDNFIVDTDIEFVFDEQDSTLNYGNCKIRYEKVDRLKPNTPYYLHKGKKYRPIDGREGWLTYSPDGIFPKGGERLKIYIPGWIQISGEGSSLKLVTAPCQTRLNGFYIKKDGNLSLVLTDIEFVFDPVDLTLSYGNCRQKYKKNLVSDADAAGFYSFNGISYVPKDSSLLSIGEVFISQFIPGWIKIFTGEKPIFTKENPRGDRITYDECNPFAETIWCSKFIDHTSPGGKTTYAEKEDYSLLQVRPDGTFIGEYGRETDPSEIIKINYNTEGISIRPVNSALDLMTIIDSPTSKEIGKIDSGQKFKNKDYILQEDVSTIKTATKLTFQYKEAGVLTYEIIFTKPISLEFCMEHVVDNTTAEPLYIQYATSGKTIVKNKDHPALGNNWKDGNGNATPNPPNLKTGSFTDDPYPADVVGWEKFPESFFAIYQNDYDVNEGKDLKLPLKEWPTNQAIIDLIKKDAAGGNGINPYPDNWDVKTDATKFSDKFDAPIKKTLLVCPDVKYIRIINNSNDAARIGKFTVKKDNGPEIDLLDGTLEQGNKNKNTQIGWSSNPNLIKTSDDDMPVRVFEIP